MRFKECFTKLRISCHKLEIEVFLNKKIPAKLRFCLEKLRIKAILLLSVKCLQLTELSSKLCNNFHSMSSPQKFLSVHM